jgi:hypothetical protein
MAEPLTNEYLKKVRERCETATTSPWISFIEGRDHSSGSSVIIRGINGTEDDLYLTGATEDDQDFIAHARQDIPLLLDEIERLQKLLLNNQ